jgi:hypothetical protein
MKIGRQDLINDLLKRTEAASERASAFKSLSPVDLNFKESSERWSILQCIEHLNLYGDFYLPEIEKRILESKHSPEAGTFTAGVIGNYFTNLMKVDNGKMTKMKSPKDKNPTGSSLSITTIDRFLKQQERLRTLLHQAQNIDLTKTKASISLTPFIKLRLGDTFRFFIYHIERHIVQAEKVHEQLDLRKIKMPS